MPDCWGPALCLYTRARYVDIQRRRAGNLVRNNFLHSLGILPANLPHRTADLECKLDGLTAATCTGSTSLGPNQWQGTLTGPTQTAWTKTFTGPQVTWAALTLTTPGPFAQTTDIDGTAAASLSKSEATRNSGRKAWAALLVPSATVMFYFIWL